MRLLALDTATEACSAALWVDGAVLERFELAGRTHTERLLPLIHELLAEAGLGLAQIDGFACGIGPGSFAGVRIAVGLVKGLALVGDRPVVGVSSLAMLAQAAVDRGASRVLPCIDARMQQVYLGAYAGTVDGLATALLPEGVVTPAQARLQIPAEDAWDAAGSGWKAHETVLRRALGVDIASVDGAALPRASTALRLALPAFESGQTLAADALAPAYLRDRVALTLAEQVEARAARVS